jgi:hypothetical protein
MSNYHFETPKLDLDPNFKTFFQDFYATSDTPDAHEHYAKYFTHDATLIMASKKVQGYDGDTPLPPPVPIPFSQLQCYPRSGAALEMTSPL